MEKNYNKWKEYDLLTAIIAIAGLALSVVEFEFSVWMANAIVTTETFNAGNSTVVLNVTGYCDPSHILGEIPTGDQSGVFQFCAE